jgi:hypothetical protein
MEKREVCEAPKFEGQGPPIFTGDSRRKFLAIDLSDYSEEVLSSLLRHQIPTGARFRVCLVVDPFSAVSDLYFFEERDRVRSIIRFQASKRLESVAIAFGRANCPVEIEVCETRLPAAVALLVRAIRWEADDLIVAIPGISAVALRLVKMILNAATAKHRGPTNKNSDGDPGQGPAWLNKKAA